MNPDVVVGHSSGEIGAAYAAGYISHHAAIAIAFHRGFLAQVAKDKNLVPGGMMSVGLGEKDATKLIKGLKDGKAVVACINSPSNVTISGDAVALDELSAILIAEGNKTFHRRLIVDTAYHSHHMQAVAEDYWTRLSGLQYNDSNDGGKHPLFVSSVTGHCKASGFGTQYWIDNLVSPVRFCDAIQTIARDICGKGQRDSHVFFIEVGPHPALAGPVRQSLTELAVKRLQFDYSSVLQRKEGALASALSLLGRLFDRDIGMSPAAVSGLIPGFATAGVSTNSPSYTWDHSVNYWMEPRHSSEHRFRRHPYHDLLGMHIAGSVSVEPQWRHAVGLDTLPWLADHVVDGLVVFPGSGYICMALEAIRQLQKDRLPAQILESVVFRDVSFLQGLVIPANGQVELQLRLKPRTALGLDFTFSIAALSDGKWGETCTGIIEGLLFDQHSELFNQETRAGHTEFLDGQDVPAAQLYEGLKASGNTYGPTFAAIQSYKYSSNELQATATIAIPNVAATMRAQYLQPHLIHPTTLDAILHTCLPIAQMSLGSGSVMPVHIDELLISATPELLDESGSELQIDTQIVSSHFRTAYVDLSVEKNNNPALTISGAEVRKVGGSYSEDRDPNQVAETCYQVEWQADQDFLRTEDMGRSPTLEQLLGYIAFKTPGLSILDIEPSKRAASFLVPDIIHAHRGTVSLYDKFEYQTSHNGTNGIKDHALPRMDDLKPSLRSHVYDVVMVTALEWLEIASSLLEPDGILILALPLVEMPLALESTHLTVQLGYEDRVLERSITMLRPSTKSEANQNSNKVQVIICHSGKQSISPWANELISSFPSYKIDVEEASADLDNKAVINSVSPERPTLIIEDQPKALLSDKRHFETVTSLLRQPAKIVWVSSEKDVQMHQTTGVLRTAHAENDSLCATSIYTRAESPSDHRFHELVAFAVTKVGDSKREREYRILESGTIMVPRIRIHEEYTKAIQDDMSDIFEVKNRAITDLSRPVELCISNSRKPSDPCFAEQVPSGVKSIAPGEVQIAVDYMTVPRSYRSGQFGEYVGVVVKLGQSVHGFAIGDRVMALGSLVGSSHPCVPESHVARLPVEVPSEKAVALLLDTMAASYSLRSLAKLSASDTVLVHGASTAVGRATIAITKMIGSRVTVTAADHAEAERLQQREEISPQDIFITRPSFTRLPAKLVFRNRLKAIIRASEDPLPTDALSHLNSAGSIIVIDSADNQKPVTMLTAKLPPNVSVSNCNIYKLLGACPQLIPSLLSDVISALGYISLEGLETLVRGVSDTNETLKLLDSNTSSKAIIKVEDDTLTSVKVMKSSMWQNQEASFVISGGLGDLGQRYLKMLAHRGATSLVTLSRSFLAPEVLETLKQELENIQRGCRLYCIKCDITCENSVKEAASTIKSMGLPPVRGVIQSSIVLRVSSYSNRKQAIYVICTHEPHVTKIYRTARSRL